MRLGLGLGLDPNLRDVGVLTVPVSKEVDASAGSKSCPSNSWSVSPSNVSWLGLGLGLG